MARDDRIAFEGKLRDAASRSGGYAAAMIPTTMGGRDWATLLILALLWGGSFLFIDVAVRDIAPLSFVWLRVTIAATALWLFLTASGRVKALPGRVIGSLLVLALFNNIVPFTLFAYGQREIASGLAAILNATIPIWGVIIAHLATRDEPLTPGKAIGILLGFGGVAAMIGPSFLADFGSNLWAQLACLMAAMSYGAAGVYARRFKAMGVDPVMLTTGQLTAGALIALPLMLAIDQPWTGISAPLEGWASLLALALVSTALAYILYFRLIASAGATNAMLVALLMPAVAVLLGAAVLGERLGADDFAGLALILLGLTAIDGRLMSFGRRKLGRA